MLTKAWDTTADCTVGLLLHYIFDLGGYSARELVVHWQRHYPGNWVRLAVIEALYQGRYKAISVEQILAFWQRRGQVLRHFNCEFERLVCGNIQPRLARQLNPNHNPNPTANSYALAAKPSGYGNHSRPPATETDADTVRSTPVQIVDVTVKAVPATTPHKPALSQSKHEQLSSYNQKSHLRSLPPTPVTSTKQQPIRRFNPETTKSSDFYTKLKAISQHN